MFGTLRLTLAVLVGLSHAGVTVFGFNPGVGSVVVFFLISGFVTSALLAPEGRTAGGFYVERLVRLMPTYWTVLAIACAIWWTLAPTSHFVSRAPGVVDWVANLTVVPLDFYMWSGQDLFTLIAPGWSLGLEMQFYLVAPLVLRLPRPGFVAVAVLSAGLYLCVNLRLLPDAGLDADVWGYRLLPGVLFIFLTGSALQRANAGRGGLWVVAGVWVLGLGVMAACARRPELVAPFNVETAFGLSLGLPVMGVLARLKRRHWDDGLATLAYPFFLLHFPVIWIFDYAGHPAWTLPQTPLLLVAWLALTLAASWLVFRLTEQPLTAWRRHWRQRRAARLTSAEAPLET